MAEAKRSYQEILSREPDNAVALHLLGVIRCQEGDAGQAIELTGRAIALRPDYAEAHKTLGSALSNLGKLDDAIAAFNKSLALRFDNPEAHYNLGNALSGLGRFDDAVVAYHEALKLKPDDPEAHNNLGSALSGLGRLDDAVVAYHEALKSKPDYPEAHNNLGTTLKDLGKLDDAVAAYREALKLKPDYAEAHHHLGRALLLLGDYRAGFQEFEWRWKVSKQSSLPRNFHQRKWDGSSLTGKTILVWGEQGVGDEIMFASLLPEVLSATSHCVIECDDRLVPLFARSFSGLEIVARSLLSNSRMKSTDIDVQISMGSLGRWLRPNIQSFRPHSGYLQADADRAKQYRKRYRGSAATLVVGISWRSGNSKDGKSRTLPLDLWDAVLTQPGIQFVNLQYGDCREELGVYRERTGVNIYQDENVDSLRDMDGFAAQVATMDLVISIDNTTVHMAGSLGVPVWTLLPFSPDWRWLLEREDSPWYSTMRLFRQNERGEWAAVIDCVCEELLALAEGDTSRLVPNAWNGPSAN